jgi:hypothetical protein
LAELQALRTKREVLPGVIARYEVELKESAQELRQAERAIRASFLAKARLEEEGLLGETKRWALAITEGDATAAREISELVASRSMARRFREAFGSSSISSDACADAKETIGLVRRFLAGAAGRSGRGQWKPSPAA